MRNGFLHDTRRFHDLRQEHLAGTKQIAHDIHSIHQRAFDDLQRPAKLEPGSFSVFDDELVQALHQSMFDPLRNGPGTPGGILDALLSALALESRRYLQQAFGGIRASGKNHVLHPLSQLRIDFLVNRKLARIYDPHVHAGANRVIQEHRVHRFAHRIIAAERKRHVTHASTDQGRREGRADP